ncbi:MAG: hypothetical protein HY711_01715 [Candidatus Melainabacteria bacterium]|nr:hypothetical protein [Candidatus Melainabacteria bacterium]
MESFFNFLALLFAIAVLVHLAFPSLLIPEAKPRKKTVGPTYWGVYEGQSVDDPESMKTIEVSKSTRKEKVIAGSVMYSAGRGTSFRQ